MEDKAVQAPGEPAPRELKVDGRRLRRVRSTSRIDAAAAKLFAERGYAGTSLDEIATEANVSKGTIFYNYTNKEALFEHVVLAAADDLAAAMQGGRMGHRGWAAFGAATMRVIERVDQSPAHAQILLKELFRTESPWQGSLATARATLTAPLSEIIAEVAADRVERAGAEPRVPEDAYPNIAMSVLGALVISTLDRCAFSPDRTLFDVHRNLMSAVSAMEV